MAFLTCSTASPALEKCFQYNAIIPDGVNENSPVILLLHGLSDDYTIWQRMTEIERYANERGIAVIMPDGGRSFYTDMKYGSAYYTSIVKDVINSARSLFHISDKRENNFTAGLSMGGYGAIKIALKNPDMFAGCVSLSGVTDISAKAKEKLWNKDFSLIWGENYTESLPGSNDDLFTLVSAFAVTDKPKPIIYSACGNVDFMIEDNRRFSDFITNKNFIFKYEEFPGSHDWIFWNQHIAGGIDFVLEKTRNNNESM